jgi:hypothetical protein
MAKRKLDFVTNSSSTCYICEITGETESGWDLDLQDAGMFECERGHIFMENYAIGDPTEITKENTIKVIEKNIKNWRRYVEEESEVKKKLRYRGYAKEHEDNLKYVQSAAEEEFDKLWENDKLDALVEQYEIGSRYEVNSVFCPICQMEYIRDQDILKFMLKLNGKKEDIIKMMREQYPTYEDMQKDLNTTNDKDLNKEG